MTEPGSPDPSDGPAAPTEAPAAQGEAPMDAGPDEQWLADATELKRLQDENARLSQEMMSHGAGVNPMAIFQERLNALVEALFPEGTHNRVMFELNFEHAMNEQFKDGIKQVRQAKIMGGLPGPAPGMPGFPGAGPMPPPGRSARHHGPNGGPGNPKLHLPGQ